MLSPYCILSNVVAVEAVIGNSLLLFIINSGNSSLSPSHRLAFNFSIGLRIVYLICVAIVSPILDFRANKRSTGNKCFAATLVSIPIIGAIICTINNINFWPSEIEDERFRDLVYRQNPQGDTAFLLLSLKEYPNVTVAADSLPPSGSHLFAFFCISLLVLSSKSIMVFCVCRIQMVFCDNWGNLSAKTICLLRQLQLTFLIQSLISLIFFVFPFSLGIVGPTFNVNLHPSLLVVSSILYILFPAFCPWLILVLVQDVRNNAMTIVKRSSISKTRPSVDITSTDSKKQIFKKTSDEKNQIVDVNAWLKMSWFDYSLWWNTTEWEGVNDLRFRKGQLWNPDVLLYNSADPQFDSTYPSNLLVYPNGKVDWIPPGLFRFSCKIDVVWFPFDFQSCSMKFGSWTYDGSKLELRVDDNGFDISNYMPNGEWVLEGTFVKRNIQFYPCCPEPYYDIVFTFVIRRRVLYYAFNLILPCFLITMLTLIGFTLPPDAGEKMSLRAFFAVCMFTCACCVVVTTLALNFHHRNGRSHDMGPFFRYIMLQALPYLLMMQRPGYKARNGKLQKKVDDSDEESDRIKQEIAKTLKMIRVETPRNSTRLIRQSDEDSDNISHLWRNSSHRVPHAVTNPQVPPGHIAQLLVLQQIYAHMAEINSYIDWKEKCIRKENDWKYAAMVVDRLCLLIFTAFLTISTLSLFISVPNLSKSF
ncbi:hypothetical protein WR25_21117 [Diploscapter pachys]|uniref:Neurotransmitter-gated ion-channel ligand-binding domain-containing protein n=1 Tax=Diploscapter pachys TaxID=2018661 RepID=A0A2A2KTI9_9BILA|nr:hypothetical protein WR25_21117 [Diploscapter pachys]